MATDKPHIKTRLRRELLRALTLTEDPKLMAELGQQLIDLLGINRAQRARAGKVSKAPDQPVQPVDGGLLGG